jgi:hypothetical protein
MTRVSTKASNSRPTVSVSGARRLPSTGAEAFCPIRMRARSPATRSRIAGAKEAASLRRIAPRSASAQGAAMRSAMARLTSRSTASR